MALDAKYGKLDVPGIPDDEPVFILRAQDALAPGAIAWWIERVVAVGCPDDVVQQAGFAHQQFLDWQAEHRTKVPS